MVSQLVLVDCGLMDAFSLDLFHQLMRMDVSGNPVRETSAGVHMYYLIEFLCLLLCSVSLGGDGCAGGPCVDARGAACRDRGKGARSGAIGFVHLPMT